MFRMLFTPNLWSEETKLTEKFNSSVLKAVEWGSGDQIIMGMAGGKDEVMGYFILWRKKHKDMGIG